MLMNAMAVLKQFLLLLLGALLLAGCKPKKKPILSGEDPVEVSDFIEFFQPLSLSYQVGDTILDKKDKDSLLISYKIFTEFVPDSVLRKVFGKGIKPKIYAIGKAAVPKAETYLLVKTVTPAKKVLFILAFDKKEQYLASIPVLVPDQKKATTQSVTIDRKYTITKTVQRKNPDASISEGKDVYVLNADARNFMLIMTEALEDKVTELINPIDTLPRKNKYSADYSSGKKLIDKLDEFLGFPRTDPHGDPIPDASGKIEISKKICLTELKLSSPAVVISVSDQSSEILELLEHKKIAIGTRLEIKKRFEFDNSMEIRIGRQPVFTISEQLAKNIFVQSNS